MSTKSKVAKKAQHSASKRARKTANYLRYGPKEGVKGKRQKRSKYGSFRIKKASDVDCSPKPAGPILKKQHRKAGSAKKHIAKHPLRPLRKRLHLTAKQIEERRTVY